MMDDSSRQSFLGPDSDRIFRTCKIGVIGLSGGGSHIVQQAAHIGFRRFVIIDPKVMAEKHLHRIVGATSADVREKIHKVNIAERLVRSIRPDAEVQAFPNLWQEKQLSLRDCTAIVGCVDSYSERDQLDGFCRRFLVPFIDIGMDVVPALGNSYHICGQAILTSPGHPCLRCIGVITENRLKDEAAAYGAAGPKPQVIWPNATLASAAIGLLIQLVCPWHAFSSGFAYLEYNGNVPYLRQSPRMEYAVNLTCEHFRPDEIGDPFFRLDMHSGSGSPLSRG